ncbi:hypothetical protein ACWD5Q_07970 [Streptomyces sp. NPDC002513]
MSTTDRVHRGRTTTRRRTPALTWVALAGVLAILGLMARRPDTRGQLYFTGGLAVALILVGYLRQKALRSAADRHGRKQSSGGRHT